MKFQQFVEGVWFDWCDCIGRAIRNVQLRDIGTIGYTWHMTKTNKHKSTTQHRKLKKWTTWASPKVRFSRRESSSWGVKIHIVRSTDLPFACPHVAHKGNHWLSSVLRLILVCIRNLVLCTIPLFLPTFDSLKYKMYLVDKQMHTIRSWIWNNFVWTTNCKTWRNYCLIVCHLSTFLSWYSIYDFLPVIHEM